MSHLETLKKTTSITCDNCGDELTKESCYPHEWGLELRNVDYGVNNSGFAYAIIREPVIERTMHYCSVRCIQEHAAKWFALDAVSSDED